MKKFLVFLVALIATVCIGVTFYQFAKNDEVISVSTAPIYINYGDKLSLNDIGFSRKEASKQTTFNFNAGGEEVTSIIKFDQATQCYIPTTKGGSTTIKISTSNRKYKTLTVDVFVGVGTEENPYYISNEKQLFEVTNKHVDEQVNYRLVNSIELKETHTPIGLIEGKNNEFKGTFDGGYNAISNLQIESCQFGGLFGLIGSTGSVSNLSLINAKVNGEFSNAGALAGRCYGKVDKVIVENPNISNSSIGGTTGGVVGSLESDTSSLISASMFRTGVVTTQDDLVITANGTLGGLVGLSYGAQIHACYTNVVLKNNSTEFTGGLVGEFIVDETSKIYESYTVCKIQSKGVSGNIAGLVDIDPSVNLANLNNDKVFIGLYYNKSLNNHAGFGDDSFNFADTTSFAINGKTTEELQKKNTYIYYVTNKSNVVYWDKVWNCVDGQYPTLIFANRFDDVTLENDSEVTNPDIEIEDPEITNPENSSSNTVIITNKNELLNHFQTGKKVTGKFVLNADIDLGGINWTPVEFIGTINGNNHTISNFKIIEHNTNKGSDFRGVFYKLSSSTIKNITFSNVSFLNEGADGVGIVVGYVGADVKLSNIKVKNSDINTSAVYAGGIAGVINGLALLENISVSNTNVSALRAAGIAGRISTSATIDNCAVITENTVITGIDLAGGIVATNYGTIVDCYVKGTIKSSGSSTLGYFGGISATNYNTIKKSVCFASINVTNTNSEAIYRVGGIAGVNSSVIEYCDIFCDEIESKASTAPVYIGGLASYNEGLISYCAADIDNIGSLNKNLYVAGLAVVNFGGEIKGCFAFGNLSGYIVAGLVVTNDNNATVDSCMAGKSIYDGLVDETEEWKDRAKYKGDKVSTFVYNISSGVISNCLVSASLECQSNDGWVAGFAGFMSYTKGSSNQPAKYGTINSCIANISAENSTVGKVYLDIATGDLMKKDRCSGTITNCVITNEISTTYRSQYDKNWFTSKQYQAGSGSNFVIAEIDKLTDISTYTQAGVCNFDISNIKDSNTAWIKAYSRLPIPSSIFNVYGDDILGTLEDGIPGDGSFDDSEFVDKWLGDRFKAN